MAELTFDDLIPKQKKPADLAFDDLIPAAPVEESWGDFALRQLGDAGQAADDMARIGANAMTFGYADKIAGYLGGEGTEAERIKTEAARDRAGPAAIAGDVLGGAATMGGLARQGLSALNYVPKMSGALGFGARTGAAMVDGAAAGALTASGYDTDIGQGAAFGALAGGAGNAAGEALSAGVSKVAGLFNKKPSIPGYDDIVRGADEAYKAADDAGVIFTPQAIARIKQSAQAALAEDGYLPANQPKIGAVLSALDDMAQGNVTLKGLDSLRKAAGNAYDPNNNSSNMMIGKIIDEIDGLVKSPQAGDVLTGDAQAASAAMTKARELWARKSKLDKVGLVLTKAERRANASGSGGNLDNATRQKIVEILNNKKQSRGFTPDERAAMDTVIAGTPGQNTLRLAGKLSPQGNGLMAALGLGSAATFGPVGAIPPSLGFVAKALADRGTGKNVEQLMDIIAAGGSRAAAQAAPNAVQRLTQSKRDEIVRALMAAGILASPVRPE